VGAEGLRSLIQPTLHLSATALGHNDGARGRNPSRAVDDGAASGTLLPAPLRLGHRHVISQAARRRAGLHQYRAPLRTARRPLGLCAPDETGGRQIFCPIIIRWPSGVATAISRMPQGRSAGGCRIIAPRCTNSACSASTSSTCK
jgi:hypothetical protein